MKGTVAYGEVRGEAGRVDRRPGDAHVRRAVPGDVPGIGRLLGTFASRGLLLPRSREQLYRHVRDFTVAAVERRIVGCAALQIYSGVDAEVSAVAVGEAWHNRGLGRRLVVNALDEARTLAITRVFAVTKGQAAFFHRLGFRAVSMDVLSTALSAEARAARGDELSSEKTVLVREFAG